MEAILHKKYIEKRARATRGLQKLPTHSKCMFTEGGVKCGEQTLPCCKFCRKHILVDKKQILFQACNVEKSGVTCKEPIANIFENPTCFLHIELRTQANYTMKVSKYLQSIISIHTIKLFIFRNTNQKQKTKMK